MEVTAEYSITVHVDNIGAIFLSKKTSKPQRTDNKNVCHYFILNYIEV